MVLLSRVTPYGRVSIALLGCESNDGCNSNTMVVPFLRHHDVADPSLTHVVARTIIISILQMSIDDDAHSCDDDDRVGIAEISLFALFRSGSKVQDVILITQEVVPCWWLRPAAEQLQGLPEPCASCPLLRQTLRRLSVSPSVNDPPFSSISATNCGPSPVRGVAEMRSTRSVARDNRLLPGTAVDSHPFFLGLHPFVSLLAIEDVEPHLLRFSLSSTTGSPGLFLSLSRSLMSASPPCSLGVWSVLPLDAAGRDGGSFPTPSRELDAPVPSTTSRSDCRSQSSILIFWLAPRAWLAWFFPCHERSWRHLQTPSRVHARSFRDSPQSGLRGTPNSCSNDTATQTLGGQTKPFGHVPGEAHSPEDDWRVNIWRMRTSVPSSLKEVRTSVEVYSTLTVRRPLGSLGALHELFVPSFLSTELSHRPASDHA